jgi:hypothetical protein
MFYVALSLGCTIVNTTLMASSIVSAIRKQAGIAGSSTAYQLPLGVVRLDEEHVLQDFGRCFMRLTLCMNSTCFMRLAGAAVP